MWWSPLAWSAPCFMSGTPKSSSSKSGKCATSSRLGSSNFSIPWWWWSWRSRPTWWSCAADGSRGSAIARRGGYRRTWSTGSGEDGVASDGRVGENMRIWEVTCPGGAGTLRAARGGSRASAARRSRAIAFTERAGAVPRATEPVGRDRRARASPRRFENHLNPNPQARGTFAFKKRAGTGKRTCCGL